MDGHIHRADLQIADSLQLPVGEIRQCNIAAGEETHPGVVVFEIQAFPHTGRHLIHKAEHTVVGALHGAVHEVLLKLQTQVLPRLFAYMDAPVLSVRALHLQGQPGIVGIIHIVQHIRDGIAVDFQQPVPGMDFPMDGALGCYGFDDGLTHPGHLLTNSPDSKRRWPVTIFSSFSFTQSTLRTTRPLYLPQALHAR